jgi:hypothetical protein
MLKVSSTPAIRLAAALAVGLATCLLATGLPAAEPATHDIWLISTRKAPWSNPVGGQDRIRCWRLSAEKQWVPSSLDDFLAADDPAVPTCIFIHGNRADRNWAIRDGWSLDQKLKQQAPDRPLRLVIWSWPADQIRGLRQDVQVKACRSEVQAYYLACVLARMNREVPLSLVGYSFGARTITGALELLAGGSYSGRSLPEGMAPLKRKPVRAVLVAAAIDSGDLLPGRRNGLALSLVEQVLVTRNLCDPALKWYRRMYRRRGPEAMGFTGPVGLSCLGDAREKVETLPVECSVGRNHDWSGYLRASSLRSRLAGYAFLEPPAPEAKPAVADAAPAAPKKAPEAAKTKVSGARAAA